LTAGTTSTINLLLLDDHVMFREGLARALEKEPGFAVTGQAGSTAEALKLIKAGGTSMVLLDVDLGPERAIDFVIAARRSGFQGQFLIVTAGASAPEAIQLVQAGVSGILHKHNSTEVLVQTIRQIAAGEVSLEKAYLAPLFRSMDRTQVSGRPKLTERDKTVLRLILQGLTNREIATRLEISEGAVKASLRHVCEKLGVRTRAQLVRIALEQYRDQL
jgi:two-component system nitrate/nitrite response regulator NarL